VSPLFKAPIASPPPPPSSSPSPQTSPPPPSPLPDVAAAPTSWSDAPSDLSPSGAEPSDTPSTGSNGGFKLSKAGLKTGVGAGFRQVTKLLSAFVGTALEREQGVWTPDPEDVEDVAKPATAIIYRRLPDDAKSNDVIDLLAVALALAGYFGKALGRRAELRAAVAQYEQQGINVHEQEQEPGGIPRYPGGGF
jgi:hypothetical protein